MFTCGLTWILSKSEKPFHWLQGSLVTFLMWVSEAGQPVSRWSKTKGSSPHITDHYSSSSSKANAWQYHQPNCTNSEVQKSIQPPVIQPVTGPVQKRGVQRSRAELGTTGLAAFDFAVACKTLTLLDTQEPLSLHSHHPPSGFLLSGKLHWSSKKAHTCGHSYKFHRKCQKNKV